MCYVLRAAGFFISSFFFQFLIIRFRHACIKTILRKQFLMGALFEDTSGF